MSSVAGPAKKMRSEGSQGQLMPEIPGLSKVSRSLISSFLDWFHPMMVNPHRDPDQGYSVERCRKVVSTQPLHKLVATCESIVAYRGLFRTCKGLRDSKTRRLCIEILGVHRERIDALFPAIARLPDHFEAVAVPPAKLKEARDLITKHRTLMPQYMHGLPPRSSFYGAVHQDPQWFQERIAPLIEHCDIDLNCRCEWSGHTPLMAAIYYGNRGLATELLKFNIDLSLVNRHGESALDSALMTDNPDMVRLIATKGASLRLSSVRLIDALVKDQQQRFCQLLKEGADPNNRAGSVSVLGAAVLLGCNWAFDALIALKKIDVNFCPVSRLHGVADPVILTAVQTQQVNMVEALIDMRANVQSSLENPSDDLEDQLGANIGGNQQIRDLLIAAGARPERLGPLAPDQQD
jgi:hypothetical protein